MGIFKKKRLIFSLAAIGLLSAQTLIGQQIQEKDQSRIALIPQPYRVKVLPGQFILSSGTGIYVDANNAELKLIGDKLAAHLKKATGIDFPIKNNAGKVIKNSIVLTMMDVPDSLGKEGYQLAVGPAQIIVKAPKGAGVFYGVQSIYQLMPVNVKKGTVARISIPAVEITDKPRFEWRGLMLDVGRYFYPVEYIKTYIDYLAMHKMNTFHWHLTEDHGWRMEIKKYPKLTEIGSKRSGTQTGHKKEDWDDTPHEGFYTHDQIREVVAYASKRYVNIVPEIEMPGHSMAALAAYPELSCTGGPFKIPLRWGIQEDVFCAGNEQTFKFLEGVLTEVADLFPSPIIHIGGDESPKARWKVCPKCQARIKAEGLKDEHELQSYFIRRIENFMLTKNKRIIGWDEILEGGLAPNAAVMSWRGVDGGIAAAKQHHGVVMTPTSFMYLDYYQGEPSLEPVAIGGLLTLEKVYSYEPVPQQLSPEEAKFIMGVQGNIWSEFIHSPKKVDYMTFPRAAALAEVAWTSPEWKDWDGFKRRMETQYKRYEAAGINYAKSAYNVWHTIAIDSAQKTATVSFKTDSYDPQIYYTLDGTEPNVKTLKYTQPFTVNKPVNIKAASFKNGSMAGKVSTTDVKF